MQSPETRLSLLASLQNSADRDAWNDFVTIYRPLIFRVAVAKGLQHADADDLTQNVLQAVEGAIESFDRRGVGSFRRWLFRITHNLTINHLTRGRGSVGSGKSDVHDLLNQTPAADNETSTLFQFEYRRARFQQLATEVRTLFSDDVWQCFWQTAVEERSIRDVAQRIGKSEGAVRVARCRVLARLRQAAQKCEDSEIVLPIAPGDSTDC